MCLFLALNMGLSNVLPVASLGRPGHRSAGYTDENVYVPWVQHTAHKHLTPGHPVGRPPPSHKQSPDKLVYAYVPFPFPRCEQGRRSVHHHHGNPPFFFSGVWGRGPMVYALLSGPVVYTLFPFFPKERVHTTTFLLYDLGVGRQTKRGGVPQWWCMLFIFPGVKLKSLQPLAAAGGSAKITRLTDLQKQRD